MTEQPVEAPGEAGRAPIDVEELHKLVLQSLDDDQAQEVVSIPLAGKSGWCGAGATRAETAPEGRYGTALFHPGPVVGGLT